MRIFIVLTVILSVIIAAVYLFSDQLKLAAHLGLTEDAPAGLPDDTPHEAWVLKFVDDSGETKIGPISRSPNGDIYSIIYRNRRYDKLVHVSEHGEVLADLNLPSWFNSNGYESIRIAANTSGVAVQAETDDNQICVTFLNTDLIEVWSKCYGDGKRSKLGDIRINSDFLISTSTVDYRINSVRLDVTGRENFQYVGRVRDPELENHFKYMDEIKYFLCSGNEGAVNTTGDSYILTSCFQGSFGD